MPQQNLDFLLVRVCRAHINTASEVFAPLKLQRSWPGVLLQLELKDGMDQTELAQRLEVSTPTMTNLLNRMETAGLVRRCKGCQDSRISNVYLSDAGRLKLDEVKAAIQQMEETTFAGFLTEEKAQMVAFLERIHTNLINK
ncbi:MAG: MarR family transcriptional regulator [Anaerolineaceae bacterium]|nr:MarR family transcriptional regulator [Anaerolineaceae bacterium]